MNLREARRLIESPASGTSDPAVFGQHYQTPDGATVITVARPVGVFVIKDGKPAWSPAADGTRIALMGILVGMVATAFAGVAMVRRPPWPDLRGETR